ncbi:GNAT family N-acetyltransferase [Paenimyroides tangerinum]|uniref:GNAT family N-acetyltransferase n=1 Tax=Paenimyroides tangerinum TaxID=2488728 RepID=A0A3P3W1I2_9FLAO|nr:GNAT family N-acetyltransferase [Paenimyroides tangerinum]RRJ88912.1 GNAT family N-acetyltransferase [Paenimyroides tangerinum]
MKIEIKRFKELSLLDLYKSLSLRNQVFIFEQNCVYQDIDGYDEKAMHVMLYENDDLVAYARIFDKGIKYETASIGRVVVSPEKRNLNLGHVLVNASIQAIHENFETEEITISAQEHLQKFYAAHGFVTTSDMYLEDDIPHVQMEIK